MSSAKVSASFGSQSFSSTVEQPTEEKVATSFFIATMKAASDSNPSEIESRNEENDSMPGVSAKVFEEKVSGNHEHGSFLDPKCSARDENDSSIDEKEREQEEKEQEQEEIDAVFEEREKATDENDAEIKENEKETGDDDEVTGDIDWRSSEEENLPGC